MTPINAAQALYLPWLHARIEAAYSPRAGYVARGTPPRLRRITDRAARKSEARELARQRYAYIEAGGSFASFGFRPAAELKAAA